MPRRDLIEVQADGSLRVTLDPGVLDPVTQPRCVCGAVADAERHVGICAETGRCFETRGNRGRCHLHFVCPRCSRAQRAAGYGAPVLHCSYDTGQCDECMNCNERCTCPRCECGEHILGGCGNCNRCENCGCRCDSDDDENEDEYRNIPHVKREGDQFHTATRKQHTENPSKRYISVELEICGLSGSNGRNKEGIERIVRQWGGAIVGDGSLPEGGFEINTAPASGDLFPKQITEICTELDKGGAWVDEHAGMHVHVDARDLTYYDMRKVVKLYAHIESDLYRLCTANRRTSHYCIPCGATLSRTLKSALTPKASKRALLSNVYGHAPTREHKQVKRDKYSECRYAALNLHSWVFRGTVECRMYHGTHRAHGAIMWGMLWAGILDCASGLAERDLDAMLAERTPRDVVLECAPTDAVRNWVRSRWNFLSQEHATLDAAEARNAVRVERERIANLNANRERQEYRMASIANSMAGGRPSWAVDWRINDETGGYQWMSADDLHTATFGRER